MKRIAVFALLASLSLSCPIRAKTQGMTGAEYGRQTWEKSKKENKKRDKLMKQEAKRQQKATKKLAKAHRKQAKKEQRSFR